jgi:hypothetical protein
VALIDALARDAGALLAALDGETRMLLAEGRREEAKERLLGALLSATKARAG